MGGLCSSNVSSQPTASTGSTSTSIPDWASKGGEDLFNEAKLLAQEPYPTYAGPRVAGFDPRQTQAFGLVGSNVGNYQPALDFAGQTMPQSNIQDYMNPYQSQVTDRASQELNRDFDINAIGQDASATQASSFGGARHGILNSENDRSRNLALGDLRLRANQAGFDTASNLMAQDKDRNLQAAGTQAALGAGDVTQLLQTGALQQSQGQANLDVGYQDYLDQREYPYRQLNFATGALRGLPYETRTDSTQSGEQFFQAPSVLGQTAGALGSIYGAYRLGSN